MTSWDLSDEDTDQIHETLLDLARRLADRHGTPAADPATPRQKAARHLSVLAALTHVRNYLDDAMELTAGSAGATGAITYADLGTAVGITRQSARTRWPNAIPAPRPGRPRSTALTLAEIGPHCHHEHACSRSGVCSYTMYVETWCRTPGCPLCGELANVPYGAMAILSELATTLDDVRHPPTTLGGAGAPLSEDDKAETLAYWERYPLVRREGDPRKITASRQLAGAGAAYELVPNLWGQPRG